MVKEPAIDARSRSEQGSGPRHRTLASLLGLALALASVLLAECAVRVLWPGVGAAGVGAELPENSVFLLDPELHWVGTPDLVVEARPTDVGFSMRTNSMGLRDAPFPPPGPPRRAILCLGDSSTWGDRVDQEATYPEQLERSLGLGFGGPPVTVLNAGIPGYTVVQSSMQARRLLEQHSFEIVLINNLNSDLFPASHEDLSFSRGPGRLVRALMSRSRLLALLSRDATEARMGDFAVPGRHYENSYPSRVEERDYRRELESLVELVKRHGASAVLHAPLPYCTGEGCPRFEGAASLGEQQAAIDNRIGRDREIYRAIMAEVADEAKVPFVSYDEVVRSEPQPSSLYSDPVHPSARGHALIARVLAPRLRALMDDE